MRNEPKMRTNIRDLANKVNEGKKLTWLTCYDYSFAKALAQTDLDMILVGDSGGMVSLGYQTTVPVTMDEMIQLSKAVRRGAPEKFIVGDMPKGSYESSNQDAVNNAMRFCKEADCDAIKLEGSGAMADRARAIVDSGIPVIGHIGLTPQSSASFGGYRVVGKKQNEIDELTLKAKLLEDAGVLGILLEAMPENVGAELTRLGKSIYFGIGAGGKVHGQLLILHDLLGLYPDFRPKFAKNYLLEVIDSFLQSTKSQKNILEFGRKTRLDGIFALTVLATQKFIEDVHAGNFPSEEFNYF